MFDKLCSQAILIYYYIFEIHECKRDDSIGLYTVSYHTIGYDWIFYITNLQYCIIVNQMNKTLTVNEMNELRDACSSKHPSFYNA